MKKPQENIILNIKDLRVGFEKPFYQEIVHGISLSLKKASITALVGASGSGKSLTALSIVGLTNSIENSFVKGNIYFNTLENQIDLLSINERELNKIRGNSISIIFQDPFSSFNPNKKCGEQIVEVVTLHQKLNKDKAKEYTLDLFSELEVEDRIFDAYPHQLSGGQLQRVGLAIALASKPSLLIADEPTTNLDASLKKGILDLLVNLKKNKGLSILYITHDLFAVKYIADEIALMYKGEIIEKNDQLSFFKNPQQDYSKKLINSFFNLENKFDSNKNLSSEKLLEVENLSKIFTTNNFIPFLFSKSTVKALDNVSFNLNKNEIIGIIGESGSGKTTLARILMMLIPQDGGKIVFMGKELSMNNNHESKEVRKNMQIVFQNPLSSLNPIIKIRKLMEEVIGIHFTGITTKARNKKIIELFNLVGLEEEILSRYPDQISGGEGQRIAIARALAISPKLLILDESISSLDRISQMEILNLLLNLKRKFNLSYIFITHDLLVSRYFCDKLLIMKNGEIIESGTAENIFNNPSNNYTKKLLKAIL